MSFSTLCAGVGYSWYKRGRWLEALDSGRVRKSFLWEEDRILTAAHQIAGGGEKDRAKHRSKNVQNGLCGPRGDLGLLELKGSGELRVLHVMLRSSGFNPEDSRSHWRVFSRQ